MNRQAEHDIRRKLKVLKLGEESGNVSHTCAAWLVSSGVPLAEVRDLLGHSTVIMTERYAHLAPENVRAAVAHLDQPMSRSGVCGEFALTPRLRKFERFCISSHAVRC
jgi:hypothetical protein